MGRFTLFLTKVEEVNYVGVANRLACFEHSNDHKTIDFELSQHQGMKRLASPRAEVGTRDWLYQLFRPASSQEFGDVQVQISEERGRKRVPVVASFISNSPTTHLYGNKSAPIQTLKWGRT